MHEAGIAAEVLEKAIEAARGALGPEARVEALRVRIGEFAGVDREALRFALEALSRNGPASGARFELVLEPIVLRCPAGHTAGSESMYASCPQCGSASWRVTAGRDLVLEGVEAVEEETGDGQGHAPGQGQGHGQKP